MNQTIVYFSGLSPIERVTFIKSCKFTELVDLRNRLDDVYNINGMFEAYVIECTKEIMRRREDKIDKILDNG